jgi:phosphate transport system substrate-binding protein
MVKIDRNPYVARLIFVCAALASAWLATGCGGSASGPNNPVTLNGAGSTFDSPFFIKAFAQYSQTYGVGVAYEALGSSSGIREFTKGSEDFGATDIPMNASQLKAYPGGAAAVVQLPIALGGVVIAYNVPGLSDEYIPHRMHLRLTPDMLGGIFAGAIRRWNDPAIAALNPGVKLPSLPIAVVNRADASGTTSVFMDYLGDSSPTWNARAGNGKTAAWLAESAPGASGNRGVAVQIMSVPGSIGYVEMASALTTKTNYAAIRNRAGNFVLPSMASVRAAAAQQPAISPTEFYVDDLGGPQSYPIAGYSWLILDRKNPDAAKGAALCSFARWMLTDGQKVAPSVGDVALPADVSRKALATLGSCV